MSALPVNRKPRAAERIRTPTLRTGILVGTDVLSASISATIGLFTTPTSSNIGRPWWIGVLFVGAVITLLALHSAYRNRLRNSLLDYMGPLQASVAEAGILLIGILLPGGVSLHGERSGAVFRICICAAILMPIGRFIYLRRQRILRRNHLLTTPTLIVGNGMVAGQLLDRLHSRPEYGLNPVGILDDEPWLDTSGGTQPDVPYLGTPQNIEEAIRQTGAECIVIAFSRTRDELLTLAIRAGHRHGLQVWVVPRMFDTMSERLQVDHVGGLPLIKLPHTDQKNWQFVVKHTLDRIAAAVVLLLISPMLLLIAVLVKLSSPGPIFYVQPRVGRNGRVFNCLKFRTMRDPSASDPEFHIEKGTAPGGVEGVDRRTRIGRILRASSLDELPQFINVLRGEMSLVGPRPERPEFVELFDSEIRRYGERHRVKAGITGWAQVHNLRGQTPIGERADWDNYYIENWSLGLDLRILLLTIPSLFHRIE